MLTFLVITVILNIALGYGLAIYLGHARQDLPPIALTGQSPVDVADAAPLPSPDTSAAITIPTPAPQTLGPLSPSLPGMPAAELPGLVSPLQSSGAQEFSPAREDTVAKETTAADNPPDHDNHPLPDTDREMVEHSTTTAAVETNPTPPSANEEDLLAGIAAFRAQLSEVNPPLESVEKQGATTSVPPAPVSS